MATAVSSTISTFRDGRLTRVAASPARYSLGVFFEHVTNLLNMRELEDEGKVMALADYAAPIADEDNPLLVVDSRPRRGHRNRATRARATAARWRGIHWRYPNEQFAYLAQRVVGAHVRRARPRCGSPHRAAALALAGGVVSNIKATRRIRLLPEVEDVYVFPHMGDGGLALGAAVAAASAAR